MGLLAAPLSRCITLYKDGGEKRMSEPLAGLLADVADELLGWATLVVAVPASRSAVRRRGFDHAYELAAALARAGQLPVERPLRMLGATDQRRLDRSERLGNVADRFVCERRSSRHEYVLLVDDVVTTGSTLDAAASALLRGGAIEVRACALARAW